MLLSGRTVAVLAGLVACLGLVGCFSDPPPATGGCTPGEVACACAGGTCDGELVCVSNYCMPGDCTPGDATCSCDNGVCAAGLECVENVICLEPSGATGTGPPPPTTTSTPTASGQTPAQTSGPDDTGSSSGPGVDTDPEGMLEPCDGCWSGLCERGTEICALGVFVTERTYPGNAIIGPVFGDERCQSFVEGNANFRAYLSTTGETASERVQLSDRTYVLQTGDVVATAATDVLSSALQHAIDRTASGDPPGPLPIGIACPNMNVWTVWTGTDANGAQDSNCANWSGTNPAANGRVGRSDRTNASWTASCNSPCEDREAALYCFELP